MDLRGAHSVTAILISVVLSAGPATSALTGDNSIFSTFTAHIARQVTLDKQAFAQASTCLTWFYKASKTPPPPAVEGINWTLSSNPQPEKDCPKQYPGGMEAARNDFAKTQTLLSVSLTVYEFALVADYNDDRSYSQAELQDIFHALSLSYDQANPPQVLEAALTARFDQWYSTRKLDDVMQGMSTLYERGYRVTVQDRADLDRIMK